tara:strand:+ start:478 stop:960 length:483 start_codon:yes stop_codon:yes gene_type:complete
MINGILKTSAAAATFVLSTQFAMAKISNDPLVSKPIEPPSNVVIVPFDISGCTKDNIRVQAGFTSVLETNEQNTSKHLKPTKGLFDSLDQQFEEFLATKDINDLQKTQTFLQGDFFTSVVPEIRSELSRTLQETYPDAVIYWSLKQDNLAANSDPRCNPL